jgi:type VI secretion system secreted protein VgrG
MYLHPPAGKKDRVIIDLQYNSGYSGAAYGSLGGPHKANPGVQDWTEKTPAHDDEGNLTTDGENTYGYDYENRLVSVVSASGFAAYYYAGDGSRVAAVTVESGSTNTTVFVLDYADPLRRPLAELDGNGALIRRFVWGRGVVAQVEADGTIRYFHHDGQGSTLALSDTNNVPTDQWFYSPYGEVMARTGATDTPYQWCGGVGLRPAAGNLYFARHRYYHARLQRWTARDPIGMAGGANLYAYANANPLRFSDPAGLWAGVDDAIFIGGGAIIGLAGQGIADLIGGQVSPSQNYIGAATAGATSGAILLYTANPILAGAGGAAMGNIVKQVGDNSSSYVETGQLQGFDAGDFARDVTVGTAVSFIPGPKIQGITAGRGSAIAVSKQITTKFANEQIQNVTAQTATKMFAGQATMNILPSTMSAAVLYGGSQRGSSMLDGGGNGTLQQYTTTPRPGK